MKTSNKLLLALIIAIFLIATVLISMIKFYHVPEQAGLEHDRATLAATVNTQHQDGLIGAVLFSPVIFLQLPKSIR